MTHLHPIVDQITQTITKRSQATRTQYLAELDVCSGRPKRYSIGCSNIAHAVATLPQTQKTLWMQSEQINIAIVSAYNDMLSAHHPYQHYPEQIKRVATHFHANAQVAGATPAMCDGITQGREGMQLSLFSRDVIAQATAVALAHDVFDAVMLLGICDKIVPGLLMGALSYGHMPMVFVPAGPMSSGISNEKKAQVRQAYAEGKVDHAQLQAAENAAYHSQGTCTFYGTANSNQMLLEAMGLHLPNSAFIAPDSELRRALTDATTERIIELARKGDARYAIGRLVNEKTIVNAIVALLASGGSTNHTIHWIAVAACAGIQLHWEDMQALSEVIPLLASIYPNGSADVNEFYAAGGCGFLIHELLQAGLMHEDVMTVSGLGLMLQTQQPQLEAGKLTWSTINSPSLNTQVLRPASNPFQKQGGIKILHGNLGRAVVKTSALKANQLSICAAAQVFDDQASVLAAYHAGRLNQDVVVVVRAQGPKANGMPELHKLMPVLASLETAGFAVALVTDGRLSGASGKVLAALHLTPEAYTQGAIGKIRDGDLIEINAQQGTMNCLSKDFDLRSNNFTQKVEADTLGRRLFKHMRNHVSAADQGAISLF